MPGRYQTRSSGERTVPCGALVASLILAVAMVPSAHANEKVAPGLVAPAAADARTAGDSLAAIQAAAKDTTDYRKQYRLGVAFLDRDRPLEAAAVFQRVTRLKPDHIEAWVNLGAAEDANGHGYQARMAYRQALALRPNDEIAMCRMAASLYATGVKDSAMDVMRDALKANPKSYCTYFTLGVAFADGGMYRDAIRAWEKVVELAPQSPEAESAKESTKLLKEYLGPSEALIKPDAPGIPYGAGGPTTPVPGGDMKKTDEKKADGAKPGGGAPH
jgi:Flp pilus assembly protein TadD